MFLLILFAFIAGIVTILSPCILPVLPIVLSGTVGLGARRPLGVVTGFILSFTFFTLFLSTIVKLLGIPSDAIRIISIIIVLAFGLSLLIPYFQKLAEKGFNRIANIAPKPVSGTGFSGGFILGLSIGLLWTPCVGPILASVIALAATSTVTFGTFLITLAYSVGTAIPMLLIIIGGRRLLSRVSWLTRNTLSIQKAFGVVMIAVAVAVYFNADRIFQSYILTKFPAYGIGLTKIEDNSIVANSLKSLKPGASILSAVLPNAPEFTAGGDWFNLPAQASSKPLTISSLRGKVVLVDFWTYTCINCIRTLPYVENWYKKYADKGLVIVGVHTPEFEFEKVSSNVKKAIADFGITYPVMQDNNYATWNAYNNQYWPAEYFIDANGKIRFTHFGEGNFDETESRIQLLLKEAGSQVAGIPIKNTDYTIDAQTPETYVGIERMDRFASPENITADIIMNFSTPANLTQDQFAFEGKWTVSSQYATPADSAKLNFAFSAKNVYLVMRPKGTTPGAVTVYLDGKKKNTVTVDSDRLYTLITLPVAGSHLLQLIFSDSNIQVYAFTFG
jgi:cytochrome c biogenesis protein CcdA/thiol-disulfide isomerase/thioredoxin